MTFSEAYQICEKAKLAQLRWRRPHATRTVLLLAPSLNTTHSVASTLLTDLSLESIIEKANWERICIMFIIAVPSERAIKGKRMLTTL